MLKKLEIHAEKAPCCKLKSSETWAKRTKNRSFNDVLFKRF